NTAHARKASNNCRCAIALIRTLSTSDDAHDREIEKCRLQEAYDHCDHELDDKIVQHYTELTTAIKTYNSITERIDTSRCKIAQVHENLLSCKSLLHCKRDELRKLWVEGVEHKHVLTLLADIESIRQVRHQLDQAMVSKRYLHATDILVRSPSIVEFTRGRLTQVSKMSSSMLEMGHCVSSTGAPQENDAAKQPQAHMFVPSYFLAFPPPPTPLYAGEELNLWHVREEEEGDPEESSVVFMAVLVRALMKLRKVPEAVKAIKDNFEKEMQQIVRRSTTQVADSAFQHGKNVALEDQPRLLLGLMELLFAKFRCVAAAHATVLSYLKQASSLNTSTYIHESTATANTRLYDMADVWAKIQAVLQVTFFSMLPNLGYNIRTEPAQISYRSSGPIASDVALRFESSSHAMSMSTYLREQRQELYSRSGELRGGADDTLMEGGTVQFVCKPRPRNITVIFRPLTRFMREIEAATNEGANKQCSLREFLTQYIKNIFLNQVLMEINKEIEAVTKMSDPFKMLAGSETLKNLCVCRPLLQSTVVLEKSVQDLMNLMHDLSTYKEQFLHMMCVKLQEYRAMVLSWSFFLPPIIMTAPIIHFWFSLRAVNAKESEVLTGNLWEQAIPEQAILQDCSELKSLANLHESLEWLASRLRTYFVGLLSEPGAELPNEQATVNEQITQTLTGLARDFQEMADRCLLVLHLEVRVHCFYYLIPLAKQGNYAIVANVESMDYDPLVVKLNKDITAMEEVMSSNLQPHKFHYIFEGLGHLIASILINGAQHFKRISESGIKKMCRNIFVLQQNLTNITMSREADLDIARQYYEMMYTTPDELLHVLVDQGIRYSELDYTNALALLHRSQPGTGDQATQNVRMQRLKEILREQNAIKQAARDKKITTV
uniref:Exocyst complex component Sec8 n=1 Tax=Eptatretus burgeri TaxID=7764 RepID=A0A8C4QM51_EPTBU